VPIATGLTSATVVFEGVEGITHITQGHGK